MSLNRYFNGERKLSGLRRPQKIILPIRFIELIYGTHESNETVRLLGQMISKSFTSAGVINRTSHEPVTSRSY